QVRSLTCAAWSTSLMGWPVPISGWWAKASLWERAKACTRRGAVKGEADPAFIAVDPTNRNTALASVLVEELARCGVRRAVISPGSRSTPLAVALWHEPAIEVTVVLDERSAGFFALGCALAGRIPAAVLCTSGSAAANLHPSVVEADEASVPM